MADNRDDHFRVRVGRSRSGGRMGGANAQSFIAQVNSAIRKAGGNPNKIGVSALPASGRFNARGRGGKIAASLMSSGSGSRDAGVAGGWSREGDGIAFRSRRVIVKARVVKLNAQRGASFAKAGVTKSGSTKIGAAKMRFTVGKSVAAHMRYLERDGVTQDGERGQAYSSFENDADGQAFVERGRDDRHQFRFIVAPEDASELDDLRGFTRDLMRQIEKDLETKLDWVAVDHHNTGHPHTHVLVRGITDDGKILNIAGDYIAHGIRHRASELMNLELGPQTEYDLAKKLGHEVDADRLTRLDRMLIGEQRENGIVDLRPGGGTEFSPQSFVIKENRRLLMNRAKKLERLGLAFEAETGRWIVSDKATSVLNELGERSEAISTMHRALSAHGIADEYGAADYVIHDDRLSAGMQGTHRQIIGRVLAKGLAGDELGDKVYLVIDGVDGRVHHIGSDHSHVDDIGKGMIIEVSPQITSPKAADRNITEHTDASGIYRPSQHLEAIRAKIEKSGGEPDAFPDAFIVSHVRRLEALRRHGDVERLDADQWRIPKDLGERGIAYDASRGGASSTIRILSTLDLERQISSDGATWVDRELTSPNRTPLAPTGYGRRVTTAMDERRQSLVEQGHVTRLPDGKIRAPKDLIARLETTEIDRVGKELAAKRGITFIPTHPSETISGKLIGTATLASGRFAVIEAITGNGAFGIQLVPWQPVLDQHLGKHISGVMRETGGVDWSFGRKRGLGL